MNYTPTATASLPFACFSLFFATATGHAANPRDTAPEPTKVLIPTEARRASYLAAFEQHVLRSYVQTGLAGAGLPVQVYRKALMGYYALQQQGLARSKAKLTIIDFGRSSNQKRLWVVDLAQNKVLFHTLVAHGKNTGGEFAEAFSNREGSEMSSLGFYLTGNTYQGKHGLSLKLQGLDASYNTNAANRAVVVHGAEYVSESFIRQHGRLGRSQGCPALPVDECSAIIRAIKGGSVVFANGPVHARYQSDWLQLDAALLAFARIRALAGS